MALTTINKTDGTVLTTIADGAINTSASNLTLIGRLYRNYGELVNENFIKLLENFANPTAPTTPIVGQLWYNTTTGVMNLYRSNGFISLAVLTTSSAQPNQPKQGDLWFDTVDAQLKMYSGSSWIVISPAYTANQTKSGVFVETIRDVLNYSHVCVVTYQQNGITSIECRDNEWIPQSAISGITSVKPGITLANINGAMFVGNATNALELGNIAADRYLRNDISGFIDGSLTLTNDGLAVGEYGDFTITIDGPDVNLAKSAGKIILSSSVSPVLKLDELGQALFMNGTELAPSISFDEDTNTGIYRSDENTLNITVGGTTVGEFSEGGLYVNGSLQADNFSGTLNADSISVANLTVTNNAALASLFVTGSTVLGDASNDVLQIRGTNVVAPNGLIFSNSNITFAGLVKFGQGISSVSGDFTIHDNLIVVGGIVASSLESDTLSVGSLVHDSSGRLSLNASVATGYANIGDFTLGSQNGIRSYNSPKAWIAFNGTLAGLAVYDSFHIDLVTRTSSNNYSFTMEYPLSSGAMAVIGTNGISLTAAPSIGATSFSITSTSEGTRMALVVLSQ